MHFSQDFIDKWVIPFYMINLSDADQSTLKIFADTSKEADLEIVSNLLEDHNWRSRITGAYFAAINNYIELQDVIGQHLLRSELAYAGLGYCLALAAFNNDVSKNYLNEYLNYYLERKNLYYDQAYAYCALEYLNYHLAIKLKTQWNSFVADKLYWNLDKSRKHFSDLMLAIEKIRNLKQDS